MIGGRQLRQAAKQSLIWAIRRAKCGFERLVRSVRITARQQAQPMCEMRALYDGKIERESFFHDTSFADATS